MKRVMLTALAVLGLLLPGFVAAPAKALVGIATAVSAPNVGSGNNYLTSVSCVSATKCFAVGSYENNRNYSQTRILEWNGSAWAGMESPNTATNHFNVLRDIDCLSSTFCMAVGSYSPWDNGQTLVLKWDGASWTMVSSPNVSSMTSDRLVSVSCVTTTMCVGIGTSTSNPRRPLIMHWDGSVWSLVTTPTSTAFFPSVSCAATNMCIAVGSVNGFAPSIMKWNGTEWSIVTEGALADSDYAGLSRVSCSSETKCIAIGTNLLLTSALSDSRQVLVMTLNGSTWTREPSPVITTTGSPDIYGMSCVSSDECVVVGRQGSENMVLTKSGTVWSTFQTLSNKQLDQFSDVACPSTTFCSAVGMRDSSVAQSMAYSLVSLSPTSSVGSAPSAASPAASISLVNARSKLTVVSSKLTKAASLSVPKGAKVTLAVSSKYMKVCKVVGTTVKTVGKGTCLVKVVVTTKSKKKTSKTVTIKVL